MKLTGIHPESMVETAPTLFRGLGSLWTRYFEDKDYPVAVTRGHALAAAQIYLDILETIDIRDRNRLPLFHRERWRPATILKSQRGQGSGAVVGALGAVGPQTDPVLVPGRVIAVGGGFDYANAVAYPIDVGDHVIATIGDGIADPEFVLCAGSDFAVANGSVYFRRDKDPFELGFPFRELDDGDLEILLWCSDCLDDNSWLDKVAGAVFGTEFASTGFDRAIAMALWDLVNHGATDGRVLKFVSAVFGQPVSADTEETVADVAPGLVVTADNAYRISKTAGVVVEKGQVLSPFSRFTDAVTLYRPQDIDRVSPEFAADVPAIAISPSITGLGIADAVSATFAESDLRWTGTDLNGNPKFVFDLGGSAADVDAFFSGFHRNCEVLGVSQADVFSDSLFELWFPSPVTAAGRLVPAQWVLRNLFPGCLSFAVADLDAVDGDTGRVALLKRVLPARLLVSVVGKRRVSDTRDFDDVVEDTELGAGVGVSDTGPAVAREHVFAKWVAVCG